MPATTTYRSGQVVVVNVPFSTQEGTKPRPAVIVSAEMPVDKQLIKRALGSLAAEDRERLVETLRQALGL